MAGNPNIPQATPLQVFDCDSGSDVGQRWEKWLSRLENYLVAVNVTNDMRKKALLLHMGGERLYEIYDTICTENDNFAATKQKLTTHFRPMKDTALAVFHFREAGQKIGETIDQYLIRLRGLAKHCEFHDVDAEIRAQIVQHTIDKDLRREILKHPAWVLDDVLREGRSREAAESRAQDMEDRGASAVNKVFHKKPGVRKPDFKKDKPFKKPQSQSTNRTKQRCNHCGGDNVFWVVPIGIH